MSANNLHVYELKYFRQADSHSISNCTVVQVLYLWRLRQLSTFGLTLSCEFVTVGFVQYGLFRRACDYFFLNSVNV